MYLGKRSSERFGRIYDKYAQTKNSSFQNCVRYEVEFKSDLALLCARGIAAAKHEAPAVAERLLGFFVNRGVSLAFLHASPLQIVSSADASGAERSLQWLRTQCRPTVQRLIDQGFGDEVKCALGLDQPSEHDVVWSN